MPNATFRTARKADVSQWEKNIRDEVELNQHEFIFLNPNQTRNNGLESLVLVHVGPKCKSLNDVLVKSSNRNTRAD